MLVRSVYGVGFLALYCIWSCLYIQIIYLTYFIFFPIYSAYVPIPNNGVEWW